MQGAAGLMQCDTAEGKCTNMIFLFSSQAVPKLPVIGVSAEKYLYKLKLGRLNFRGYEIHITHTGGGYGHILC